MWLLKTGDPLIQVHLHCILVQGTQLKWLFKTDDPLIEVTTLAGLTVLYYRSLISLGYSFLLERTSCIKVQ